MGELKFSPYLRLIQQTGSTRHPGGFFLTDYLLGRTHLTKDSRVLDVGCGAGHTSAHIAKTYGCHVVGVDISIEAIERAQSIYRHEQYFEQMSFHVGDACDLHNVEGEFDVVLCESVLIFIEDKHEALEQMASVLKPGGFLALNELCASGDEKQQAVIDFFAQPQMGGFLTPSSVITTWFSDVVWNMIVVDEQPFDMKAQLRADWAQWANFRGLLQTLEAGFHFLLNKQAQSDLLAVLRLAISTRVNILEHLNLLLILAQQTSR